MFGQSYIGIPVCIRPKPSSLLLRIGRLPFNTFAGAMAPCRLSSDFKNQPDIEKAAAKLDEPFTRKWRHYWSSATAKKKDEQYFWVTLRKNEFNSLFDSRVRHMKGEAQTRLSMPGLNLDYTRGDLVAIAFWHNLDHGDELPACVWSGLESAVRCGGFAIVYLLSHQTFRRILPGVTPVSAERTLSIALFGEYLRGLEMVLGRKAIAAVSDLVRIKACAETEHAFAVMIDCDTVWLRKIPLPDSEYPMYEKSYGHSIRITPDLHTIAHERGYEKEIGGALLAVYEGVRRLPRCFATLLVLQVIASG